VAEQGDQEPAVGARLAELRHAAGVTGAELARRIEVSQSKISRLENGSLRPRPADILAIGRALGAPDADVRALLERVATEPQRFGGWRPTGPAPLGQQDIGVLERESAEIRGLNVTVVPGLLQADGYTEALLAKFTEPLGDAGQLGSVPGGVTARKQRQEILGDGDKVFLYVLAETALLNRIAGPAVLLAQVEAIRARAALPNVLVRILRADTELAYPPLHDFVLLDERVVVIETMTTTVLSRESLDLVTYRRVFEELWDQATPDIGPVLDSYAGLYARLAQPAGGTPTAVDLVSPPPGEGGAG
jgi:transcriptional regulator with XRE-family HTH domain